MLKSLSVAAILVLSLAASAGLVTAQTSGTKSQLALTNHRNDATSTSAADKPVTPEARSAAKKLYKEGIKYGLAGLYPQAAATFEKVVALDPQFADAYFSLGHAYFDMKRWADAAKNLERALDLNPKDVEAQDRLSFARTMLQPNGGGTKPAFQRSARSVEPKRIPSAQPQPVQQQPVGSPVAATAKTPAPPPTGEKDAVTEDNAEATENKPANDEMALTRIYRIGGNDVLDIRVADSSSSQSTLFTVTPAGFLEHPLLAEPMQVSGLTVEEITSRI